MFKLSKKVEYALMALSYLYKNKDKNKISVRDISNNLHVPFDTVSKVLQTLNSHQIVGAEKGIHGGYFLKNSLDCLNLYDFCQLIEPKSLVRHCTHLGGQQDTSCELLSSCTIISAITSFNILATNFLKQISIQELLDNPTQIQGSEILKMNTLKMNTL